VVAVALLLIYQAERDLPDVLHVLDLPYFLTEALRETEVQEDPVLPMHPEDLALRPVVVVVVRLALLQILAV
jgi:hypothetical protein